jgi:hypothetical protein
LKHPPTAVVGFSLLCKVDLQTHEGIIKPMLEFLARYCTNLVDRIGGPMTFRIILQPAMAILLAVRAGLKDAREGRPPFLWTILTDPTQRVALMQDGWKGIARVFVLAIVMDVIYQVMVLGWVYPGETITVAVLLAVVPYLVLRGLVNRVVRHSRSAAAEKQ